MTSLEAPYDYVTSEEVLRDAFRLLSIQDTAVTLREPPALMNLGKLKGLGKGIWRGVDAQQYVDSLRNEWEAK